MIVSNYNIIIYRKKKVWRDNIENNISHSNWEQYKKKDISEAEKHWRNGVLWWWKERSAMEKEDINKKLTMRKSIDLLNIEKKYGEKEKKYFAG